MHPPGGFCLAAAAKFEAGCLTAAGIHELSNSQPTHSQVSPLKIVIPYLKVILSAPAALLNNPGPPLATRLSGAWLPSCEAALGRGALSGPCGCSGPERYFNFSVCLLRSWCLK